MANILTAPLFLILLLLTISYILILKFCRKKHIQLRYPLAISFVATAALWLLSAPAFASGLALTLESRFRQTAGTIPDAVDVVVILASGMHPGPVAELDLLSGTTYARVYRGIGVFRKTGARYLVMSGRYSGDGHARMVQLMKQLAQSMGVPAEQILIDPRSTNTYQHPAEVSRLPQLRGDDTLAVVTSAWHLPRALNEFRRHFPNVRGVPADFHPVSAPGKLYAWLPQVSALEMSTTVVHEWVGQLWYWLRHQLQQSRSLPVREIA